MSERAIQIRWSVALGVAVALGRWLFSRNRIVYHLHPDEAGNLAMARWISGGTRWNMFDHSTWRPGLATITAPIYWITDDPTNVFRGVLIVNALLAGVAAVLLAKLALRLTELSPTGCVLAAGAVALAPPSLSATANAWAESLVTLTFLATLWFLLSFFDRPRLTAGGAAAVCAAAGFTSHGRLLPLIPLATLLTVGGFLWRRDWWRAVAMLLIAAAAAMLSSAWADYVFEHVWDSPADSNTVGDTLERLKEPLEVLEAALGQTWYQLVATLGLFGIGMIVAFRAAFRRRQDGENPPPSPVDARVVLALTVPLIGVSWVFMSDRTRSDHLVYGRYTDAIIWPVLVIAIAWVVALARGEDRRDTSWIVATVAIATYATAIGVYAFHHVAFDESVGVRPMVAGFMPWLGERNTIPVFLLTGLAMIGLAGLLAVARWPGRRSVVLLGVVAVALSVAGLRTHDALSLRLNVWAAARAVTEIENGIVPPGESIGFRFVREADGPSASWDDQRRRAQLYQMYLPDRQFLRDRGVDDAVGPYVFAPVGDPQLVEAGAEILWTDPNVQVALWREPSDR